MPELTDTLESRAALLHGESAALIIEDRSRRLIVVRDQATLDLAAAKIEAINALIREAHDALDPQCVAAHAAWKVALAQRDKIINPLEIDRDLLKRASAAFMRIEDEKRRAEQLRLEEEERTRQAELREKEIEAAERDGAPAELVAAIVNEPLPPVSAPVVAPSYQRPQGIALTERWKAEVFDTRALIRAIADGKADITLFVPNMTLLNTIARQAKGTMSIPGVRAFSEAGVTARR